MALFDWPLVTRALHSWNLAFPGHSLNADDQNIHFPEFLTRYPFKTSISGTSGIFVYVILTGKEKLKKKKRKKDVL